MIRSRPGITALAMAACALLLALQPAAARGHAGTGHHKAAGVARDSHGKIRRSAEAKREFEHAHPCPSTGRSSGRCPGYVIDHVVPLKRGGADAPANMQWQTTAEAKAKDKVE